MSIKNTGIPPVVVAPSPKYSIRPTTKQTIHLQAVKVVFVGVLASAAGHQTAAEEIEKSTFSLFGDTLQIQTNLSAALLPLVFNGEAHTLMEGALAERGSGNIKIKLLSAADMTASKHQALGAAAAPLARLTESAAKLNKVSDQLTSQVEQIDAALKQLNLGVSAWVTISENEDQDGNWTQEQLGYVRIGSRWGVALKTGSGTRGDGSYPEATFSAFADAPRQLRIRAVEHISKLLDQLSIQAEEMIAKLEPKLDEISELTVAFRTFNDVSRGREISKAIRATSNAPAANATREVKK